MNPELKAKWLEALRSGRYQQGKTCLRAGDAFCCLGVLCDVSEQGKWTDGDSTRYFTVTDQGAYCLFPPTGWLGREMSNAIVNMNDEQGKTFNEIADWLEANV